MGQSVCGPNFIIKQMKKFFHGLLRKQKMQEGSFDTLRCYNWSLEIKKGKLFCAVDRNKQNW